MKGTCDICGRQSDEIKRSETMRGRIKVEGVYVECAITCDTCEICRRFINRYVTKKFMGALKKMSATDRREEYLTDLARKEYAKKIKEHESKRNSPSDTEEDDIPEPWDI